MSFCVVRTSIVASLTLTWEPASCTVATSSPVLAVCANGEIEKTAPAIDMIPATVPTIAWTRDSDAPPVTRFHHNHRAGGVAGAEGGTVSSVTGCRRIGAVGGFDGNVRPVR